MNVTINTRFSAKANKRIHRVGVQGTAHSFLVNDDDLAELVSLAQEVLNGHRITD